jgi:hypothetical protein
MSGLNMPAERSDMAMRRVSRLGHEMGALEAAEGWRDLWQCRCIYCGGQLCVYHGLVVPERSHEALLRPCPAAERLAAWRARDVIKKYVERKTA